MKKKYIVGLDLSTVSTGLVILRQDLRTPKIYKSYTFTASKKKEVHVRIYEICKEVRKSLNRIKSNVEVAIIEAVYNIKWNTQSLLEVRGGVINILIEFGIPFEIIAASKARYLTYAIPKAVKGTPWKRDEKKAFVRHLVEQEYNTKFKNNDESDAALLCLAWTRLRNKDDKR